MPQIEYYVVARKDDPFASKNIKFKNRIHRVTSKKEGSNPDKFLKDFLEIIDVITLPVGYVEANCEWMLKTYLRTDGKEGWSEQTVFDFLLKLGRKPSYIRDYIDAIKSNEKILELKKDAVNG